MTSRRRQLVGLVLLIELSVAAAGCSVLFVDGPPPRPRRPDFDCTSTYGVPALDTGMALLALGILAMRGSAITNGLSPHDGLLLGFSATFLVSAIDGYQQVYACREALDEAAPPPETPHHYRPPPSRPAPASVTTPSAPPVPQQPDSFDAP
jgi:hypothetical protein